LQLVAQHQQKTTAIDTMASFEAILRNSMSKPFGNISHEEKGSGAVLVDYKKDDYRGFCLCIHEEYGLMMLHCTRKKDKGPHYQLAGGHIDEPEFLEACELHFSWHIYSIELL
jgi:hypothetical protein